MLFEVDTEGGQVLVSVATFEACFCDRCLEVPPLFDGSHIERRWCPGCDGSGWSLTTSTFSASDVGCDRRFLSSLFDDVLATELDRRFWEPPSAYAGVSRYSFEAVVQHLVDRFGEKAPLSDLAEFLVETQFDMLDARSRAERKFRADLMTAARELKLDLLRDPTCFENFSHDGVANGGSRILSGFCEACGQFEVAGRLPGSRLVETLFVSGRWS